MIASGFTRVILTVILAAISVAAQCIFDWTAANGETCAIIASAFGITEAEFIEWNPSIGPDCDIGVVVGDSYCVAMNATSSSTASRSATSSPSIVTSTTSTQSTTLTTITTTTATTSGNGITTPTPYQTGMATNCDSFYLVASGAECGTIATEFGISLTQFYAWNPAVGSTCEDLGVDDYVCVDVIGVTATTTTTTTTTSGNGITTPPPYQTGMATDCDSFHLVVSGDQCSTVASAAGISLADFYAWNPAVGSTCEYLDVGDYVCIDIVGVTPTTTTSATTTTGNGITTPTPYQTGMATDCDSFYLVVSGDECATVASNARISLADFYAWNLAVGSTCEYLDLGYYVCIGTT